MIWFQDKYRMESSQLLFLSQSWMIIESRWREYYLIARFDEGESYIPT